MSIITVHRKHAVSCFHLRTLFEKPIYFLFVSAVTVFFADLSFYFLKQLFSVCLKYYLVLLQVKAYTF